MASLMLLIIASIFGLFVWQAHTGLNLLDEGYLWYGAQRVMVGEVPLRDFMSYDIGRYYWSAAFMKLWGSNGIVALRFAIAIFQITALFIGMTALTRHSSKQNYFFWSLVIFTLIIWMYPQYRVFDIALPIILIFIFSYLIERPSWNRYFMTGLTVGLVAVFGRNHGMYGVVGSLGVMFYLSAGSARNLSLVSPPIFWLLGVLVGYLPVLVFIAVVPGFAQAFWDGIRVLFEAQTTNIPVPVPWPWLMPFDKLSSVDSLSRMMLGIFFIATILFGLLSILVVIRRKLQAKPIPSVLVASAFLALPYAHYAYSRADILHLAPGIIPFLIGVFALLASQPAKIKWLFAVLLCGASLLVMLPTYAEWDCYATQQCVEAKIAGDTLKIRQKTATILATLSQLAERYAPDGRTFVAAPLWPGAYAALERKSPMWEIYLPLYPPSVARQQSEIAKIKTANPGFVVIYDLPLDGRNELSFGNMQPILDQYIRDNFEPLNEYAKPLLRTYKAK
jgi:hypothetical protein